MDIRPQYFNQKDAKDLWLKLIIKGRSVDSFANSSSSRPQRSFFATTQLFRMQ